MKNLKNAIRNIPDFPKEGIVFRDISTLLGNYSYTESAIDQMIAPFQTQKIDCVLGVESRGFIFGSMIAQRLKCNFVMVRKAGKLPYNTYRSAFQTTYGSGELEIQQDALQDNDSILIVDDVLAAGGTTSAVLSLVRNFPTVQVAGLVYLIELSFLNGRSKFQDYFAHSVLKYKTANDMD